MRVRVRVCARVRARVCVCVLVVVPCCISLTHGRVSREVLEQLCLNLSGVLKMIQNQQRVFKKRGFLKTQIKGLGCDLRAFCWSEFYALC